MFKTFFSVLWYISKNCSVVSGMLGDEDAAKKDIMYAQDVFRANPECLEFSELIDQAQVMVNQGDYAKAKTLATSALQMCKDVVALQGKKIEIPRSRFTQLIHWIIEGVLAFIVIILLLWKFMKHTKKR